jgi:hypothetical protein
MNPMSRYARGVPIVAAAVASLFYGCGTRPPLSPEAPASGAGAPAFFEGFDGAETPQWESLVGEWSLRGDGGAGQYAARPRQYALTVAGDTMWTSYQVEAQVTVHDDRDGQVGLAGRVQGSHYYYELLLGRDDQGVRSWFIRQQRNHVWVTLASGPLDYQIGTPYKLRFVLRGNSFEGHLSSDGGRSYELLGTATATGENDWGLGKIGLVTYGGQASFDDVTVAPTEDLFFAGTGPWGPLVTLRDDTGTFAGRPSGGWYVTPIHVNLRASDGKVVITGFGRKDQANCTGSTQRQVGETWILDPAVLDNPPAGNNLLVQPLDEKNLDTVHDVMYCAGHVTLPGGRIFYTAGTRYPSTLPNSSPEFGVNYARIFDPTTNTFTRISAPMKGGQTSTPGQKWYPTNMAMPDGRVLTFGGFHWSTGGPDSKENLSLEVFDPAIWDANHAADPFTVLTQHSEGQAQTPPTRGYTNLLLLPKPVPAGSANGFARSTAVAGGFGKVFLFNHEPGPSGTQRLFARTNALTVNPSSTEKGEGSSGILLPDGRVMFTNGGHDGAGSARAYTYDPYADAWTFVNLGISRIYSDALWLPDGTILVINGYVSEPGNVNDVVNPVGAQPPRQPQIINPFTSPPTVTTLAAWPEPTGRGYHAVSLLLKDGRVLVGGGKDDNHATGCEKNELRIFEPPYVSAGPRPSIQMAEGQTMQVGSPTVNIAFLGAVRSTRGVALLRTGSLTHGFDQGQRYVPLAYSAGASGTLNVTPPPDVNVAPPGDYVLYFISDLGVPSTGVHVKVTAPPACVYTVNGNVDSYLEAEGRSRQTGPFVKVTDATRAGGAYEQVTKGTGSHTTVPDEGKVMWYDLNVSNGGTFTLWMLANGPDTGSDSFWFSVDGGPDLRVNLPANVWGWVSPGTVSITTGTHTIKVKVREDGALVDKILLTKNTTFTPTGLGGAALSCGVQTPPAAPTGLTATPGDGQVALSWNAVAGATSYTVKMGLQTGGPYTTFQQGGIAGTSFTKTGLTNGTTYFFVVSASNGAGEGPDSTEASATPQAVPPPAPSGLTATAGNGQVVLSWNTVASATSYTVKMGLQTGGPYTTFQQGGITATTFTKTGLTNGTTYFFVVSATNTAGEGPNSTEKSATPSAAPPISNLVVNDNLPAGCVTPNCNRDKWSIQSNFQVGNTAFGDRTYTIDSVPAAGAVLLGKSWIRTAADSKNYTVNPLATFTVTGTFVYLLVDNRWNGTTGKPAFLDATWTDQGYDVVVRQSSTATFPYSVWRKSATSGTTFNLPALAAATAPCYLAIVQ